MAAAAMMIEPSLVQQAQPHRNIAPRPPSVNGDSSDGRPVAKRQQVLVACAACQKRKSKCTGQRPRCSLCDLKDTECVYDTRAGEARGAHLKRKVGELTQEIDYLKAVINTLRTTSFEEGSELLRRIQSTNELEEALQLISDSSLLLSVRSKRPGEEGTELDDSQLQAISPIPDSYKRKRQEDHQQARKDPRMSIEQLTCANNEMEAARKNLPYYTMPYPANGAAAFRPDLPNYGSVQSDGSPDTNILQ